MDQTENNSLSAAQGETRTLCEFLAGVRYENLPLDVVSRTEDFFLDWLGSGLAGKGSRPVRVLEQFAKAMGPSTGPAEILTYARTHFTVFCRTDQRRRFARGRAGRRAQWLGVSPRNRGVPSSAGRRAGSRRLGQGFDCRVGGRL